MQVARLTASLGVLFHALGVRALRTPRVLALDFDGVVCASDAESSVSAVKAASLRWPDMRLPADQVPEVQRVLSALRPHIETGYENMLLVRLAADALSASASGSVQPELLLKQWSAQRRESMLQELGESREALIGFFGLTRDRLIAEDGARWLALNRVYPQVRASLLGLRPEDYCIVTTKQRRFVEAIMGGCGLAMPRPDNVFDLDGPIRGKPSVLRHLLDAGAEGVAFVEDRFETLLAVAETEGLERIELFLVDWGYNTPEQRAACRLHPRIRLIGALLRPACPG